MNGYNPYNQYPYNGYGYQNYNRQYNQPQQQISQQQMQQPIMPTLCYAKIEEARPYIITAPNASMLFIDREKGKALLKSTDNMCNSYSRFFTIEETDENGNLLKTQQQAQPQMDLSQFAKKDELNGFVTIEEHNKVLQELHDIKSMLSTQKTIQCENKQSTVAVKQVRPNTQQD